MTPKIHIACPDSTFYGIRRHTFWALILSTGDAHCTLSQLVTGYPYTRKVPYKAVKCHLGAENGARTRDLNLLARPPQTAFISVDDGSYATDPREKEANEFARHKLVQHRGLSITQDFIICHTVRLGLICRKY